MTFCVGISGSLRQVSLQPFQTVQDNPATQYQRGLCVCSLSMDTQQRVLYQNWMATTHVN